MKSAIAQRVWRSVLLAALGGCSVHGIYDHAHGWRDAVVVEIGRESELSVLADRHCPGDAAADSPYLVVRFRDGGLHSRSLGKSVNPSDAPLRIGDEVRVNIFDCGAPIGKRILD
ncbi:hypothetical protein ACQ858_12625 [Variovorax ureilyticus]|uniref:hypothetical protein n=1 Tax=Variovorax ureilyticus TaxID=1836198 RepID=UPI003D67558F